jgi:prolipoprotein diacylglyceryltransferase
MLYGIGRILLEWTRGDAVRGFVFNGALSTSQLISLGLIVVGIGLQVWVGRQARK